LFLCLTLFVFILLLFNTKKTNHSSESATQIYLATEIADTVFLGIFTVECVFKIIALGLFRERVSYLKDAWNWLDFVVVVTAWLERTGLSENMSALRTFRVLRPLRTLTTIPGMKLIIVSMMQAGAQLGMVGVLCLFVFFVFGIVGIQLWAGLFEARCHIHGNITDGVWDGVSWALDENDESLCGLQSITLVDALAKGLHSCDTVTTTCSGSAGRSCNGITELSPFLEHASLWSDSSFDFLNNTRQCRRTNAGDGPSFGFGNFDNIGHAIVTIITSITLEGWVDNMYNVNDTFGREYLVVPYFMALIVFGSCFLLNLFLAVIWLEYDNISAKEKELDEQEKAEVENTPEKKQAALIALQTLKENKAKLLAEHLAPKPCCKCCFPISRLVTSLQFELFVTALIILNTISLGVEYAHMPQEMIDVLTIINYFFTAVFAVEMLLKMAGLGLRVYIRDGFNLFDCLVVCLSFVEITIEQVTGGGAGGLSVFRSFRLFRVFKLARSWKDLRDLLATILASLKKVSTAAVLLTIIIFIFALVGMQLYAGEFSDSAFEGDAPSAHFDDIFWAHVTVFQILTGENWNEVLYNGMHVNGAMAVAYFLLLSVVGNYVILNLFLAILLEQFEQEDEEEKLAKEAADAKRAADFEKKERRKTERRKSNFAMQRSKTLQKLNSGDMTKVVPTGMATGDNFDDLSDDEEEKGEEKKSEFPPEASSLFCLKQKNGLRVAIFRFVEWKWFDRLILSLILISSILLAIDQPYIVFCSGQVKGATNDCLTLYTVIKMADLVLTFLFLGEFVLKNIALGVIVHKGSYWRDAWNQLDGSLVIISIISLGAANNPALKALRSFRSLRGLRPLRVVRRYPGMRLVVNSIIKALPKIQNVVMVTMFFFLIFAIIGVQNFKGAQSTCNDPFINEQPFPNNTKAHCTGNWVLQGGDCALMPTPPEIVECQQSINGTEFPRVWAPLKVNFDNLGHAMITVYEITSGEMWPDIMYNVAAATPGKEDVPLIPENNQAVALYFAGVIFVCSFIMLNVFIGVVIDNFNKMKEQQDGSALMTDQQKKWVQHIQNAMRQAPIINVPPPKGWRRPVFKFVESTRFEWFIMICIILNTLLMASRHAHQSEEWNDVLFYANIGFVVIFAMEATAKLIGLYPAQYFRRGWNQFDFTLVILSFAGMIFNLGSLAGLFRIFRVARVFRLIKSLKGLRILFQTVLIALPSVVNVGTILLLAMFIFAVMGMNLFANTKWQENLNRHANFWSFDKSMMTLFRCFTGESYNAIMHDATVQPPYCSPGEWVDINGITRPSNCGNSLASYAFFCMYFLLANYILLNLLVAIIIDSLVLVTDMHEGIVKPADIDQFRIGWAELDPDGDSMIPIDKVCNLIIRVNWPLGLKDAPGSRRMNAQAIRKNAERVMMQLEIRNYDGEVNFHETIVALMNRALGNVKFHSEGASKAKDTVTTHLKKKADGVSRRRSIAAVKKGKKATTAGSKTAIAPMGSTSRANDGRLYTMQDEFGSRRIQYAWRKHKSKRRRKLIFDGNDDTEDDERDNK
jgi:hypothetical protein